MEYRYGSHTVFKIQYYFVCVTKYRHQVLRGDIGLKVRELIRQICQVFKPDIEREASFQAGAVIEKRRAERQVD